jgi:hypothetical protein
MRRNLLGACAVVGAILMSVATPAWCATDETPASPSSSAEAGVRAAILQYFAGHATGDPAQMRKAFLPTAHIEGIRDGKFTTWTVDEYCAFGRGKPADDESKRVRTIDAIDVSGNAAMAKATLVHGNATFTDYFVLLHVDGEWKIANKVYSRRQSDGQ